MLGYNLRLLGSMDDEFQLGEQSRISPTGRHLMNLQRRTDAAKAFLAASSSARVRRALLARSRPTRREYSTGDWCYYWRHEPAKRGEGGAEGGAHVEKVHWHGPADVVAIEPSLGGADRQGVIWIAHGSSLMQTIPEYLRPEYPAERTLRQEQQ